MAFGKNPSEGGQLLANGFSKDASIMTNHTDSQNQHEQTIGGNAFLAALNIDTHNRNTLWMGDLEAWMDENFVRQIWLGLGEQVVVKMIRDKFTG